jgi:hypothetical protein
MVARISVIPVGAFFCAAIGAAFCVTAATLVDGGGAVAGDVVVETSTDPSRSGTRVCDGPDAGGGIGAVLFGFVVDVVVDDRVVEVFVVVVVVDAGVVTTVLVVGLVVVVCSGGGSVGRPVCALTPAAPVSRHTTSAPKQTQGPRRTPSIVNHVP